MTLTTHALVGAAAAALVPEQPVAGFILGFVSHLAIDAIPHWDYDIYFSSLREDRAHPLETDFVLGKAFLKDFVLIAGDGMLGLLLSYVVFHTWLFAVPAAAVFAGSLGGEIPDALQFLYFQTRSKMLEPLQRFHLWIQEKSPLMVPAWEGLGLQCALVMAILGVLKLAMG